MEKTNGEIDSPSSERTVLLKNLAGRLVACRTSHVRTGYEPRA